MRAWQASDTGGHERLAVAEIEPPRPGAGEVLIEVHACGLNFSDLLMLAGTYQVRPPLPFVPGQEIAGRVVGTGQRVATKLLWGGFAEYAVARRDMLIALPEGMPFEAGATLPVVWPTAWIALFDRARLQAGETVLVHAAAGGVGLAAVQLARSAGASVIAGVGDDAKSGIARAAGARRVVNTRTADWHKGISPDVIFDPVGGELADASLKCLARGGRYLIVGFAGGKIPELRANRLLLKNASALGVYWSHDHDRPLIERSLQEILRSWEAKQLRIEASARYAFERLPEALSDLGARRTTGKCVLTVKEGE
jgi:NADPH2:quinone reductase